MPTHKPGDRVGRYRLLEEIGHGGCGVVYMAEQEEPVRRKVALKVIKLGMDTREVVARFQAERQALALMDHPNIAKVLDAGATETGRPYFVMELVGGIKITDYCDQHQLTSHQRLDLFIQVCHAIQHAHQKGIIHRDIKPSNVLITMQDRMAVPKVIDFGIAKATQGRLTDQTLFTAFEQFLGTPAYMSPEQAQLGSLDVDTRSDIYSLGVLLYELLAGKTPFDTKEMLAAGLDEMRRTIREVEPVKPSTRLKQGPLSQGKSEIRNSESEIDKDLDSIVMKCLEKDRGRRYETANGLARDIERHLKQEPVIARPPSNLYRFQKAIRRNKLAATAGAVIAIVLLLGIAGIFWQWWRAETQLIRAERAETDALARLHEAKLNYIRANRLTGRPGQRFDTLAEIAQTASRTNSLDLRNEAIACLALPDLRPLKQWAKTPSWHSFRFDSSHGRYFTNDALGNLTVRDTDTDAVLGQVPVHASNDVNAFAFFSPDDRWLAATDPAGRAQIWDWPSRTPRLLGIPRGARLLAFTPDSRALVARWPDASLHFLNVTNGADERAIPGPGRLSRNRFQLNASGEKFLAVINNDVIICRTSDGKHLSTLAPSWNATNALARAIWHPDGRRVASAWLNHIGLWEAETGRQLATFEGHEGLFADLAFTRDGQYLISTAHDQTMRLWDTDTQREALRLSDGGIFLAVSADDRWLSFQSLDNQQMNLYELPDVTAGRRVTLPPPLPNTLRFTAQALFSPDGELVATPDKDAVYLFDASKPVPLALVPMAGTFSASFSADGSAFFTGGTRGAQRWPINWSADRSELHLGPPEVLEPTRGLPVSRVELSRDGQWLVAQADHTILTIQTTPPFKVTRFPTGRVRRHSRISHDGRWVTTITRAFDRIEIWDGRTGKVITNLPTRWAWHCAFSPDGRSLAGMQFDSTTIWNTSDWSVQRRIPHTPEIIRHGLEFSPDGRLLATFASDWKVRLLRFETGEVLGEFPAGRLTTSVRFNSSGDHLLVANESGYYQTWDLRRVREQLASLNLDWDMPPYPPAESTRTARPFRVIVHTNAPANRVSGR